MSDYYVYSTLAADVAYTNHIAGGADMPQELPPVCIHGGAGVANDRLVTPRGVATAVTAAQVEYLRANEVFKLHEANGYVMISEKRADPDTVAADMEGRDVSAPLVPQDNVAPDAETVVGGVPLEEAAQAPRRGRPPRA